MDQRKAPFTEGGFEVNAFEPAHAARGGLVELVGIEQAAGELDEHIAIGDAGFTQDSVRDMQARAGSVCAYRAAEELVGILARRDRRSP